jgi:hypothetical protein
MSSKTNQKVNVKGPHTTEVVNILTREIGSSKSVNSILEKAVQVIEKSVDPAAGPPSTPSDGLLYGLIQSGKTSVITVATALAADNGFQCILILTSDIDLLYDQTLDRARTVLRGLSVLGKNDWRDAVRFESQLRTPPIVIVCSKNGSKLGSLLNAFKTARAKKLSTLIIDDEADQASLNTFSSKRNSQVSKINEVITELRDYFPVNTYLQVTATPQALFLQSPNHRYRPSFTLLSTPGPGYVGGEAFFGQNTRLIEDVDINEVNQLKSTNQPSGSGTVPSGLKEAICTFLIAATSKILSGSDSNYAFLCHVSVNKRDHEHIVGLIDRFREDSLRKLSNPTSSGYATLLKDLKKAYDNLLITDQNLPKLDIIVEKIKFYLRGAIIRLINASTSEEIKLDAAFNLFIGGNKLGRGVTIKNLLVSYYGRNPQRPNSDTVLQHARMYGYREKDISVTRLFLPARLADHFRLIHLMEDALREIVENHPQGNFEGLYISNPLQATRRNVLDPNAIGLYVAGRFYNPRFPLRKADVAPETKTLDKILSQHNNSKQYYQTDIHFLINVLKYCHHDPVYGAALWNKKTINIALEKLEKLLGSKAYLVVIRGRKNEVPRNETQGIHTSGEENLAPTDAPALFLFRQDKTAKYPIEVWWPQLRFPIGNYVLAFSFER